MANEIHPGNERYWTLTYKQDNGAPGLLDPKQETKVTMVPEGFAEVEVERFEAQSGTQRIAVRHNGSVASGSITITNDGDLGSGVVPISAAEEFVMLAPGGATSVSSSVSDERPITTAQPVARK